ncbi:MAG: DinB family protein [Chitinophagaceae bacterium]|nr:DinB family protein [Chitinophagaceae bacterium]
MRKRTKGYFFLAFLVAAGLAGTQGTDSLSKKERKFAVTHMKDTRADFLKSVKGLTDEQLNFKPAPDRWSIKECAYHIALSENNLWQMLEGTLKAPANPEKRSEIKVSDEQLIKMMTDRSHKVKTFEAFEPKSAKWKTLDEALADFKGSRQGHMSYLKSTTEDLRNHVAQTPLGWVDCYQMCLFISAHTSRHTLQINELKADPNFPK